MSLSNRSKFFTPLVLTTLLIVSFALVLTPAFAADSKANYGSNSQVNKKSTFLDKFSSFVKAPFTGALLAQGNQYSNSSSRQTKQPSLLQQIWGFFTAPFKALSPAAPAVTPKKTPRPAVTVSPTPTATPAASTSGSGTSNTSASNTATGSTASSAAIANSLAGGATYVDLIGKTIIDSNGNVYPSGAALAQTNKPSLGTSSNRYYGLLLNNFKISSSGEITTGLSGAIVKAGSTGVLSSSAVQLDSTEVNGTLQAGNGGTGQNAYTTGDILYSSATNVVSRLAIGSSNQILTVASGIPSWSGTLSLTSGAYSSTLSISDGTAATPGLNFTNDTDSGLWRIGANSIALTTAGSDFSGISIDASGNVGIGVTGATTDLQVNGNAMIGYGSGTASSLSNGLAVSGNV